MSPLALLSLAFSPPKGDYPPGASPFCAKYHPIHDRNVYDPSGPILDKNGVWHTWEDDGGWSHWTSTDLIHWKGDFTDSTHFSGDTGSVSPTPSGVYAFWPILGHSTVPIGSAKATNDSMLEWTQRGATIQQPARIDAGFRDPVRAFELNGKWYLGVGCGSNAVGAQFCIFEASDDTLSNFTDRGSMFTTNVTFGNVDDNVVWQPTNVSANMMECPDFFPLGDKFVLIASLYKTNQWWVGEVSGDPPRFTPSSVGILDYGNGYAAKTGTTFGPVQSGDARRLNFGFTGWNEPTMPGGCGRALIIPRELSIGGANGDELITKPIAETAVLRVPGSRRVATAAAGATSGVASSADIATGSQVEVRLTCPLVAGEARASGKTAIRTLATADGSQYTEIGYDFDTQTFYANHSLCCSATAPNAIVQAAPLPVAALGGVLNLTVWVDGGVIEAFLGGKVITPLVAPDVAAGAPEARVTTVVPGGLSCSVESHQLRY